jgi:hypothetical protein
MDVAKVKAKKAAGKVAKPKAKTSGGKAKARPKSGSKTANRAKKTRR